MLDYQLLWAYTNPFVSLSGKKKDRSSGSGKIKPEYNKTTSYFYGCEDPCKLQVLYLHSSLCV